MIVATGPELCDGIDNDCDGVVDNAPEADLPAWYRDADGDGFGDPDSLALDCDPPVSHSPSAGDCDDFDPAVQPDADEVCDGLDNNCDGEIDEGCDGGKHADPEECGCEHSGPGAPLALILTVLFATRRRDPNVGPRFLAS